MESIKHHSQEQIIQLLEHQKTKSPLESIINWGQTLNIVEPSNITINNPVPVNNELSNFNSRLIACPQRDSLCFTKFFKELREKENITNSIQNTSTKRHATLISSPQFILNMLENK
ncbi:5996_t:CDS:1, partial [Ambispora leptoticha]